MPLVDLAACEALKIEQVNGPGLLLPVGSASEVCLCLPGSAGPVAVFLSGEYPYYSDQVANLSNRRGLFIPNVLIRADLDSRVEDLSTIGAVVLSDGVYGIRTYRAPQGSGFAQKIVVQIGGGETSFVHDAVRIAFPKWEIGQQIGQTWTPLWSVDVSGS